MMGRPPAPSVPPPGWDELLPKEEQSLLWQENSKEDQETWHQQVENYVQAPGEQEGDIIWEQPEGATTWQEDLGDGWSGGYGPLTVQAGMVVGASEEGGEAFRQFLEVRFASISTLSKKLQTCFNSDASSKNTNLPLSSCFRMRSAVCDQSSEK